MQAVGRSVNTFHCAIEAPAKYGKASILDIGSQTCFIIYNV
jgi:hypothetical protein